MAWVVKFFTTTRGESPVRDFIFELDEKSIAKVSSYIELLKTDGPFLKPPYIKKLENKLYELRVPGVVPIRIFYTAHKGEYWVLHAFKKKSQKTPAKEIRTALDRIRFII